MKSNIYCSIIGHRKISETEEFKTKVTNAIEDLIVTHNVTHFLFGGNSKFDDLCHQIVTNLKKKHPFLVRVVYLLKSEFDCLPHEKEKTEQAVSSVLHKNVVVKDYDKIVDLVDLYTAGKSQYIKRNYTIIENSNICLFYLNTEYVANAKVSGTAISYNYAKKKGKPIIVIS